MNIKPVLDAIAPESILNPVIPVTNSTSGISSNIFSISLVITLDRCNDAASGSWTLTKKYPISSSGIKPPGNINPNIPAPAEITTINITLRFSLRATMLVKLI